MSCFGTSSESIGWTSRRARIGYLYLSLRHSNSRARATFEGYNHEYLHSFGAGTTFHDSGNCYSNTSGGGASRARANLRDHLASARASKQQNAAYSYSSNRTRRQRSARHSRGAMLRSLERYAVSGQWSTRLACSR